MNKHLYVEQWLWVAFAVALLPWAYHGHTPWGLFAVCFYVSVLFGSWWFVYRHMRFAHMWWHDSLPRGPVIGAVILLFWALSFSDEPSIDGE